MNGRLPEGDSPWGGGEPGLDDPPLLGLFGHLDKDWVASSSYEEGGEYGPERMDTDSESGGVPTGAARPRGMGIGRLELAPSMQHARHKQGGKKAARRGARHGAHRGSQHVEDAGQAAAKVTKRRRKSRAPPLQQAGRPAVGGMGGASYDAGIGNSLSGEVDSVGTSKGGQRVASVAHDGGADTTDDGVDADPNGYLQDDFVVDNHIVQYSTSADSRDMDRDFEHIGGQTRYRPLPGEDPEHMYRYAGLQGGRLATWGARWCSR